MTGHAIEVLLTEDPSAGYLPSPGTLHRWRPGPGAATTPVSSTAPSSRPTMTRCWPRSTSTHRHGMRPVHVWPYAESRCTAPGPTATSRRCSKTPIGWPARPRRTFSSAGRCSPLHRWRRQLLSRARRRGGAGGCRRAAGLSGRGRLRRWGGAVPTGPAADRAAGGGYRLEVAYRLAPELEVIIGGTTMPGPAFANGPGAG